MEPSVYDLTSKPNYKMNLFMRIKWWLRRRKYIKERAKRGWSSYDVWDFDTYLATVISGALEFLAHSHMSHPYDYTPEDWSEKLSYISKCFKQYLEEPPCPAYEAWCAACERVATEGSVTITGSDELAQAWHEESVRNHENKMNRLKEGFDLLFEIYPNLWD
jgi:hypothetical protein